MEGLLRFDARSANTMSDVMKNPTTSHIIDKRGGMHEVDCPTQLILIFLIFYLSVFHDKSQMTNMNKSANRLRENPCMRKALSNMCKS